MATVTISTDNGTAGITELDTGNAPNGENSDTTTLFIRHDASNPITDVGFYLEALDVGYTGDATAELDLAEVLAWGDATTADAFGGLQINQDAGAFPIASWPTYDNHEKGYGAVFNNAQGASSLTKIPLSTHSGAENEEEIQVGEAPNVRVQLRFQVPQDEDTPGVRQARLKMYYTYTS